MDISSFLKNYADQIGGQYTAYNKDQSIIIVPVSGNRFQTVIGTIKKNDLYNRSIVTLNSKVCDIHPTLDYKMLLEQASYFNYCRFIISGNHLQIEAVGAVDGITETDVKEMIQEVANLADQYEMKLTGSDIH
jgi:hypothetical protein